MADERIPQAKTATGCAEGSAEMRKKMSGIAAAVVIAGLICAAVWMLYQIPGRYRMRQHVDFREAAVTTQNPLMGYAPMADNTEAAEENRLVYILLTWRDWEPEEGEYAVEALEERFHILRWKQEGKNAVLRFVCDIPGTGEHMDIPDWLYEKTGDGVFYDTDYGKGYAPVYENENFLEAHGKAISALAEYCNQDSFVAYVQLGSLGHWGEWHTKYEDGLPAMPEEEICREYMNQYIAGFQKARLMTRRNYSFSVEAGLGVFNDMAGMAEDTAEWLGWLENGGAYEIPGRVLSYKKAPELWKSAPVGGEFTSSLSQEYMLSENLQETLELIGDSHMTFLGPKCPHGENRQLAGAAEVLERLGYCYWISSMDIRMDYLKGGLTAELVWENRGAAPMYFDWPVMLYVYDPEGNLQYQEQVELKLSELYPGEACVTTSRIPLSDTLRQGYTIGVGILSPDTGKPDVELGMEKEYRDGVNLIHTF